MHANYRTAHNNWDAYFSFPFVVGDSAGREIYIDPIWAIKIDRVLVDGVAVSSDKYETCLDDINYNKITIGSELFIYMVKRSYLVFATTFSEGGEYELEKYVLPATAKHIAIGYHLRYSPNSLGPLLNLESYLV